MVDNKMTIVFRNKMRGSPSQTNGSGSKTSLNSQKHSTKHLQIPTACHPKPNTNSSGSTSASKWTRRCCVRNSSVSEMSPSVHNSIRDFGQYDWDLPDTADVVWADQKVIIAVLLTPSGARAGTSSPGHCPSTLARSSLLSRLSRRRHVCRNPRFREAQEDDGRLRGHSHAIVTGTHRGGTWNDCRNPRPTRCTSTPTRMGAPAGRGTDPATSTSAKPWRGVASSVVHRTREASPILHHRRGARRCRQGAREGVELSRPRRKDQTAI